MHIIVWVFLLWSCGFTAVEGITVDRQQQIQRAEGASNVQMRCTLQRYGVVQPVTITWFHSPTSEPGKQITSSTHFTISAGGTLLTVDRLQKSDSGIFTAVATDSVANTGNCTFFLQVTYGPIFEPPANPVIVANAGQDVILTCLYDSNPESRVTWLKNGTALAYNQKYVLSGRNLTIIAVDSGDSGGYQCQASNIVGNGVSSPISLNVLVPMAFVITPPTVSILTQGQNVTLTCSARGSPLPTIEWRKDRVPLTSNDQRIITQSNTIDVVTSSMEYNAVDLLDKGEYSCNARNPKQAIEHLFEVAIHAPPEITSVFRSPMYIKIGSPMVLHCQASGIPKPSFTWFKDDRAIARVAETHFQEGWDGYLRVTEIIGSDAGLYQCRAVNDVGEAFSEELIIVVSGLHFLVKPRPNKYILTNSTARMNCEVSGSRNGVLIDWLKDGKRVAGRCTEANFNNSLCMGTFIMGNSLYINKMTKSDEGIYTCIAKDQGTINPETIRADSRIRILVPVEFDPPLPPRVRGDFHRSLTIRCQATGMPTPQIEWLRHGLHVLNNTYRTVIGGLMKFRALHVADADRYTCIATNKAGEKKQNVHIVINTVLTTPAALSVGITPFSYFAKIVWNTIANGGYPVTSFQLEYRQIEPTVTPWTVYENIGANQRSMGIKKLDPESRYQINIWANNKLGKGEVTTMEFETKESESGGILELSIPQLIIIVVIILAAVGMLITIICIICIKRHGSNLTVVRARRGEDDNQALVQNQQDQSSHLNPAYEGGKNNPQKDMELKEVTSNEGGGAKVGPGDSQPGMGVNGGTKKETSTT